MTRNRSLVAIFKLVAAIGVVVLVAPAIAGAGSNDDQAAAEAKMAQHKFVEFYNARAWEQVGTMYAEDAVAIPPNHEPIQGRAAIVEYWKGVRDIVGEAKCGEPLQVTAMGNFVAMVSRDCSAYGGRLGFTTHELYERQPDGSLRYKFDMFGMR